ncbi:MAG: hypothetical protein ACRDJ4_09985 [Actinomycetota bacterium]
MVGAAVLLVVLCTGLALVSLRILGVPLRAERDDERDPGRTQPRSARLRLLLVVAAAAMAAAVTVAVLAAWVARVLAGMLS